MLIVLIAALLGLRRVLKQLRNLNPTVIICISSPAFLSDQGLKPLHIAPNDYSLTSVT